MTDFEKLVQNVAELYWTDGISEETIKENAKKLMEQAKKDIESDLRKKVDDFNEQLELLHDDYKSDGCVEEAAGIGATRNLWYKIFPEFDPR